MPESARNIMVRFREQGKPDDFDLALEYAQTLEDESPDSPYPDFIRYHIAVTRLWISTASDNETPQDRYSVVNNFRESYQFPQHVTNGKAALRSEMQALGTKAQLTYNGAFAERIVVDDADKWRTHREIILDHPMVFARRLLIYVKTTDQVKQIVNHPTLNDMTELWLHCHDQGEGPALPSVAEGDAIVSLQRILLLKQLGNLSIEGIPLAEKALKELFEADLGELTDLSLNKVGITPQGIGHIVGTRLTALQSLSLSDQPLTKDHLEALRSVQGFSELRKLYLAHTGIDDSLSAADFPNFPQLEGVVTRTPGADAIMLSARLHAKHLNEAAATRLN